MLDRHADAVRARADAVRLHRRAFRWRVLRRARCAGDVLDLIARHVRGEVRHVPKDPEDLLVAQSDVMEERDDREAAHVRHVLVVLDLGEQVVHARREAGDAHLADVFRFERRLLDFEYRSDLFELGLECLENFRAYVKGEVLLYVLLNGIAEQPQYSVAWQIDIAIREVLVY